jgi:AraC-like DNA-binding protein
MGITASDVTAYLGCSRELVDLRFRETEGITLREAIENFRLNEVKRLLKSTNRPISTIARQCGFKSASHLSHLFKHRTGMTPGEWKLNFRFAPPS